MEPREIIVGAMTHSSSLGYFNASQLTNAIIADLTAAGYAIVKQDGSTPMSAISSEAVAGLVERLKEACSGHPHAKIAWPHRLLHEAVEAIVALRSERDGWRKIVGDIAATVPLPHVLKATGSTGDLIEWITAQSTRLSEQEAELARQREHIRKQAEDIMTLSKLVYDGNYRPVLWKDRADSLKAEVGKLRAALERIAQHGTVAGMHEQDRAGRLQEIARQALGGVDE